MHRVSIFFLIMCLTFPDNISLANRPTARFLLWQPSAASMSMGGIGTSYHFPGFEVYNNPALLVHQGPLTLSGSFFKPFPFFQNIVHSYASIGFQVPRVGFFAVSCNMYWKARQAMTDANSSYIAPGESEYLFSWQGKISYGIVVKPGLFLGVNLGYLNYNLWEEGEVGVGAERTDGATGGLSIDLGVQYVLLAQPALIRFRDIELPEIIDKIKRSDKNYGVTLGLALHNFGPSLSFNDNEQADPLPTKLLLGTSIPVVSANYIKFNLALDIEKQINEESTLDFVRSGADVTLYQLLKIRGGYVIDTFDPITSFGTWGVGLQTRYFAFQVAHYEATFLPTWHYDLNILVEL